MPPEIVLQKKLSLMNQAWSLHEEISPCSGKDSLHECFTVLGNRLCFWFNTPDHSTHILTADLS